MKESIFFGVFILFSLSIAGQDNLNFEPGSSSSFEAEPCMQKTPCFEPGERLTYVVYYNWGWIWVSAGEVTFTVNEIDTGYHLHSFGSSYPSYEWFFKINNRYESFIDPETYLPYRSIRDINEGSYSKYEEVVYDRSGQQALTQRGKNKGAPRDTTYSDIEPCVHDLLSIIYYARSSPWRSDFPSGYEIPVDLFFGKREYNLALTYKERIPKQKIKKLGNFDVLRFSPELIKGELFEEGDEANIYVTNDDNKLPVLIESPLSVGKVKVVLKEYEGLKYPLNAWIK